MVEGGMAAEVVVVNAVRLQAGVLSAARLSDAGHRVSIVAHGQRLAELRAYGIVLTKVLSGWMTTSTAGRVLDHLEPDDFDLLAFFDDLRIPLDNNEAERVVRLLKVPMASGCFRSHAGADVFVRLRGYLSTLH